MSVSITKFTGGLWTITTLNGVYSVNLDTLTLTIVDDSSQDGNGGILEIVDFFADHGGTMNLAFRHEGNPAIKRHVSSIITSITPA